MFTEFFEKNPYFKKIIIAAWTLLALFLLVLTLGKLKEYRFIGSGMNATNTISVTGHGSVDKSPDTAKVTFTVENESKDVKTAQDTVSKKVDAIKKALMGAGIEEKYIKTDSYNSYPQYDYPNKPCVNGVCPISSPVLRGYQVSHSITVSIKNLDNVETVVGILGQNAVTNITGPNFGFEDDKAVAREARDMAIDDAKTEAQKLAKSLGVHLVRIVSYSENNGGSYPRPMYAAGESLQAKDMAANAPSIPVGSQKVDTDVTIVYEIR